MAHFRGTVQGTREEASRLGTKDTGLTARVQSWGWDLVVTAKHVESRDAEGHDVAVVELVKHGNEKERRPIGTFCLTTGQRI